MGDLDRLNSIITAYKRVLVCYSGGVDSTLLLRLCCDILGKDAVIAFTGNSSSLPRRELDRSRAYARELGVNHLVENTDEGDNPAYIKNPLNRCYYCKSALMVVARRIADKHHIETILIGTNADDLGQHRPGLRAANEGGAQHPLALAGLDKEDVRRISRNLNLPTWAKPEMPCLASRVPYGSAVTPEVLTQIECLEDALADEGIVGARVRHHGTVARIEAQPEDIPRLALAPLRQRLTDYGKKVGFSYIAVDLAGYRRGALNEPCQLAESIIERTEVVKALAPKQTNERRHD